ncbi:MAG: hypothetical protein L0387_08655 [Acidobacteria bacterium]|nr:hypothetical protein [Acidobacteriota bacterium]MCI0621725.1 hypothetical protein [Acidobacteriota bacterium]
MKADSIRTLYPALRLRVGELVEVRSAEEILATLDKQAKLEDLPFMPEMLKFCGKRFRVFKRADKACDTIQFTGMRRLQNTVHLEKLRCDGDEHGGCQARCMLFWKEAWLRRVPWHSQHSSTLKVEGECEAVTPLQREVLTKTTRDGGAPSNGQRFYCQATELWKATSRLPWWDVRQYARDLLSGNVTLGTFCRYILVGWFNLVQTRRGGCTFPYLEGRLRKTPIIALNLQPGELVKVKPVTEIVQTLDTRCRNRGLSFDVEMFGNCGGTYRVAGRVEKLIDEKTGKMKTLANPSILLDGAICPGFFHRLCPRSDHTFWREVWLKRVQEPGTGVGQGGNR